MKNKSTKGYIFTLLSAFVLIAVSTFSLFFGLAASENQTLNQPFPITDTKNENFPEIKNAYENIFVLNLSENKKYLSEDKYISEQFVMASIEKIVKQDNQTLSGYGIISLEDYTISIDNPLTFWQASVTSKSGAIYYIALNALDGEVLYLSKTNDYYYINPSYITQNFNLLNAKRIKSNKTEEIRHLLKNNNSVSCSDFIVQLSNKEYYEKYEYTNDYDSIFSEETDNLIFETIEFLAKNNESIQNLLRSYGKGDIYDAEILDTYINEVWGISAVCQIILSEDTYLILTTPFYFNYDFSGYLISPVPYEKIDVNSLYNPFLYFNYSFFFGQ